MQRQAWMIETHFRMRLDKADVFFPERPSAPTMIQVTITPAAEAEVRQGVARFCAAIREWGLCAWLYHRGTSPLAEKDYYENARDQWNALDDHFREEAPHAKP